MLKSSLYLLLLLLLGWAGCSQNSSSRTTAAASAKTAEDTASTPAAGTSDAASAKTPAPGQDAAAQDYDILSGLYREVDGRRLFVPCGEPAAVYELSQSNADLSEEYSDALMQGYPGQAVVIEVEGKLQPDTRPQPERAGELRVRSLRRMRAKNPRNTCVAYDFWALGNEPFWSLQISAAEGLAEFAQLGARTVRFDYAAPTVEADGTTTRYYFAGEQRLKVTITEEDCTDSMAGNPYTHTATVEYAGKTYRGCAMQPQ